LTSDIEQQINGRGKISLATGCLQALFKHPELKFTHGYGVELNRPLVWYSKWKSFRSLDGREKNIKFICQDMWKANLSEFQTIVVFGVESMVSTLVCVCW
uniref:RING-type E3 ubiquitin transferase n=1 Tax=Echinostoma caproni TaxID=27848 RepID=A0A183BEV4_9TREM